MNRYEQFEKLNDLVQKVTVSLPTKDEEGLNNALASLSDTNAIEYEDIMLLDECLDTVDTAYRVDGKREKPSKDAYVLRRLYTTTPVLVVLFLTLAMLMPSIFNIYVFPSNILAAVTPFALPFLLHLVDKKYVGAEICRVNKQGFYTADDYLECDSSIFNTADFLRWQDIEVWQYKQFKSLQAPHPVLYIQSKKYPNKLITINHFHRYGLKTLKLYAPKAGKVV